MNALPPVNPGIYPGAGLASLLRANEQQLLFSFAQGLIAAGNASIAVQLERIKSAFYPFGASYHIWFTNSSGAPANPGAFELDIQNSDIDTDGMYVTMNAITSGLNSNYATRLELPSMWTRFTRGKLVSITNAGVYANLLVTR